VLPERFTVLERDLRMLGLGLARAASAPRWTPALSALADTVREGFAADAKRLPGVAFDDLDAALTEFRATSVAVESGVAAGPNGADADRLLMATRHALVPWLYMADGEYTQAVRTTEYANRVAALDAALGALRGGDRDAARKALDAFPEGRRCRQMSAAGYAFERNFWAGEGGWASRYTHRAPPPLPAFDAACRALQSSEGPAEPIAAGLEAARTEALQTASASVALVTAKLRAASATLQSAGTPAAAPR
jgi:hypothetical protein